MRNELIESDPAKVNEQPCLIDTRLTVRPALTSDLERKELCREFPELDEPKVQGV